MTKETKWLKSDSIALWTPGPGKKFKKATRKRYPKVKTLPGSGRGRRKIKMALGE